MSNSHDVSKACAEMLTCPYANTTMFSPRNREIVGEALNPADDEVVTIGPLIRVGTDPV